MQYVIQPIATRVSQMFRYICLWNRRHPFQLLDSYDIPDLGIDHFETSESKSLLVCRWIQQSPHLADIMSFEVVSERWVQQLNRSGMLIRAREKWTQFGDGILKRRYEKR